MNDALMSPSPKTWRYDEVIDDLCGPARHVAHLPCASLNLDIEKKTYTWRDHSDAFCPARPPSPLSLSCSVRFPPRSVHFVDPRGLYQCIRSLSTTLLSTRGAGRAVCGRCLVAEGVRDCLPNLAYPQ